jgi:hypothetical protein
MTTANVVKSGSLIRCTLPGRKQPRIYAVVKVAKATVTLRLAWAEGGKDFPVLGVPKDFKRSELRDVTAYERDGSE